MKRMFSMLMAITMLMCAVGIVPISVQAIEYTYDDLNEYEIKYNISYYKDEGSWSKKFAKIQSVDELPDTSEKYAKYDEDFFENKFLIVLEVGTAGYSRDSFRVVSVTENESTLDIDVEYSSVNFGADLVIPWLILLEVDRTQLDKELSVRRMIDATYYTPRYYSGGVNIDYSTLEPQIKPYMVKVDSAEKLEDYTGDSKDEIVDMYNRSSKYGDYLLFVQWVEPTAGRSREVVSVLYDRDDEESQITIKLSAFTPEEEYPTVITPYCAVIEIPSGLADRDVVLEYDDAPQKKVVTVEPPTVNLESGEVPYGSKVTISPTDGNDFEYSVNGEQFINSRLTHNGGNAVITITEDTVLVVRSMIDVVEPDTEYIFPEATYTYTIGGCVVPAIYPYTINSLKLVSENGEEYDTPPTDKSFIVDVDITKNSERESKDYFIVAVYDTDGALISMNYIKANLPASSDFSCGVNIPKTDKTIGSIKAFVWDALGGMTPLAEGKAIECSALSLME